MILFFYAVSWVGHACVLTYLLNHAYGRPWPKSFLKPFRYAVGVLISAFPIVPVFVPDGPGFVYLVVTAAVGGGVFPVVTIARMTRRKPAEIVAEKSRVLDMWAELGPVLVGDGEMSWTTRLPFTCAFEVEFTDITLKLANLPAAWDGLTVDVLSDLHFHGSPAKAFYDRVVAEIAARPAADLVVLAGDFVDSDAHVAWVRPVLGGLKWAEHGLAVLGNHDEHHRPDAVRGELTALGFRVLGNRAEVISVRGVECVVVGHEGPWFRPPPVVPAGGAFRLCVSHSPDNFYWGRSHGMDLMLSGHVHGGQIRLPLIGSIFVPSVFSRRFDQGVFSAGGTVMVVGRGLSGKEPLRFRCRPQVIRLTLTR